MVSPRQRKKRMHALSTFEKTEEPAVVVEVPAIPVVDELEVELATEQKPAKIEKEVKKPAKSEKDSKTSKKTQKKEK